MQSKPKAADVLKLYLAVSEHTIRAILTREEDEIQQPIYYASKALCNAELHYSLVEKLAYALVIVAQKLRPYFWKHPVKVLTNSLLRQTL